MPRRKLHYKEGDWFAVPLKGGGYALGLIARMTSKSAGLFGYFFGPKYPEVPTLADAARMRPSDAILLLMFGDLDLLNREWPVLGALPGWDRQQWPMPKFVYRDAITRRPCIRTYDEDTLDFIAERWTSEEEAAGLPKDGLAGAGAVVTRLSRVIREQEEAATQRPPVMS